jgi:hypothetical protein
MPKYQYHTYNDIPKWLECPVCFMYQTRHKSYFLKHFKNCEEYDGHIDDVEDYNIDDDTTIGDYIEKTLNCIEVTKELIRTNELKNIENQPYLEIKEFIKRKLVLNFKEYPNIDNEIIYIYNLFFGETEESEKDFINLVKRIL